VGGRHRNRRRSSTGLTIIAAAVTVLAILGGAWGGYRLVTRPSCVGEQLHLSVTAAPEIAPVIRGVANRWMTTAPKVAGRCVAVEVATAEPADVAAAVAGQHGTSLNGVGQASGKTKVPDVWVPDSSMWLQRLRVNGADYVPTDAPSIARSPVVLAMPEPIATSFGWPSAKITWTGLLQRMLTDTHLRPGIVEPTRDASGLSGLLAMAGAASSSGAANAQQSTVAALRALSAGRSALRDDLLVRFPRAADPATLASGLSAAPLSEQAVITYNASQPPVRLAAVAVTPAPVGLDYPYTVLPVLPADKSEAAAMLRGALSGGGYRDRLAARGLRDADGSVGADFSQGQEGEVPPAPATPLPAASAIDRALSTWTAVTLPARMLAVIDVSGSMQTPVPTAGGATREQVTVEAARRGLGLFDDTWAVGLWTFSTLLDGANDYRQLVPIGPLATQRTELLGALAAIRPKPGGETGLYDTILAAYQTVQNGWDPGRVNSVVILTDGQNQDPKGISLDQLTASLQKLVDPKKPIMIIAIGIGTEVSQPELQKITATTGGGVFVATDPSKIGDIFLQAIALRTSAPR
jgi:Ca-activated chloride channel homolog